MRGAITLFFHTPSWHTQRQLYVYLSVILVLFRGSALLIPSLNYSCFTEKLFNHQRLAKFEADILILIDKIVIYYFW